MGDNRPLNIDDVYSIIKEFLALINTPTLIPRKTRVDEKPLYINKKVGYQKKLKCEDLNPYHLIFKKYSTNIYKPKRKKKIN